MNETVRVSTDTAYENLTGADKIPFHIFKENGKGRGTRYVRILELREGEETWIALTDDEPSQGFLIYEIDKVEYKVGINFGLDDNIYNFLIKEHGDDRFYVRALKDFEITKVAAREPVITKESEKEIISSDSEFGNDEMESSGEEYDIDEVESNSDEIESEENEYDDNDNLKDTNNKGVDDADDEEDFDHGLNMENNEDNLDNEDQFDDRPINIVTSPSFDIIEKCYNYLDKHKTTPIKILGKFDKKIFMRYPQGRPTYKQKKELKIWICFSVTINSKASPIISFTADLGNGRRNYKLNGSLYKRDRRKGMYSIMVTTGTDGNYKIVECRNKSSEIVRSNIEYSKYVKKCFKYLTSNAKTVKINILQKFDRIKFLRYAMNENGQTIDPTGPKIFRASAAFVTTEISETAKPIISFRADMGDGDKDYILNGQLYIQSPSSYRYVIKLEDGVDGQYKIISTKNKLKPVIKHETIMEDNSRLRDILTCYNYLMNNRDTPIKILQKFDRSKFMRNKTGVTDRFNKKSIFKIWVNLSGASKSVKGNVISFQADLGNELKEYKLEGCLSRLRYAHCNMSIVLTDGLDGTYKIVKGWIEPSLESPDTNSDFKYVKRCIDYLSENKESVNVQILQTFNREKYMRYPKTRPLAGSKKRLKLWLSVKRYNKGEPAISFMADLGDGNKKYELNGTLSGWSKSSDFNIVLTESEMNSYKIVNITRKFGMGTNGGNSAPKAHSNLNSIDKDVALLSALLFPNKKNNMKHDSNNSDMTSSSNTNIFEKKRRREENIININLLVEETSDNIIVEMISKSKIPTKCKIFEKGNKPRIWATPVDYFTDYQMRFSNNTDNHNWTSCVNFNKEEGEYLLETVDWKTFKVIEHKQSKKSKINIQEDIDDLDVELEDLNGSREVKSKSKRSLKQDLPADNKTTRKKSRPEPNP